MTHVPYKGVGPALNDLIGGQIQLIFSGLPQLVPQYRASRVRGIAVTSAKRSSAVPELPTVGEAVAGYEAVQWQAIMGPKALPKDIVTRWNSEINRILQLPDVKERLAAAGSEPVDASQERLREVLKRDVSKWQKVVKIANIKPGS
jgi:tripartite-type tricarboxylate transporter receptor subunit TctC